MNRKKIIICLSLALLFVFSLTCIACADDWKSDQQVQQSINRAITYLHSIQNEDGGFPSKAGRESNASLTSWVIMALAAAGEDVTSPAWAPAGSNPVDFLNSTNNCLEETTNYARMLMTLTAVGQGPIYQDNNLAEQIASFQQDSGQFVQLVQGEEGFINSHMWSILALASARYDNFNQEKAREWLLGQQNQDGGFGWIEGIASDSDDTGIAIQTLVVLGETPESSLAIKNALKYLEGCQEEEGGFNCGDDWMATGANTASNSWALQGLIAAGENPLAEKWTSGGKNPVSYLLNVQNADGSFNWKPDVISSPVTMTAYSIMALSAKPFPVNVDYYSSNQLVPANNNGIFKDLSSGYWAYDPIMELVEAQVLKGYPDGTFKPEKSVSRAEFAKFLVGGLGLEDIDISKAQSFPDVGEDHWAYKFISINVEKGYVKGMPDGTFNPGGEITGAELATMIVRTLPAEKIAQISTEPYWYSGYVSLAAENNLLYPGFQPEVNASRAQCAYSIVQLRNLLSKN